MAINNDSDEVQLTKREERMRKLVSATVQCFGDTGRDLSKEALLDFGQMWAASISVYLNIIDSIYDACISENVSDGYFDKCIDSHLEDIIEFKESKKLLELNKVNKKENKWQ